MKNRRFKKSGIANDGIIHRYIIKIGIRVHSWISMDKDQLRIYEPTVLIRIPRMNPNLSSMEFHTC
jgi:hypothetical protein